jgi:hypothetical protein
VDEIGGHGNGFVKMAAGYWAGRNGGQSHTKRRAEQSAGEMPSKAAILRGKAMDFHVLFTGLNKVLRRAFLGTSGVRRLQRRI